MVNGIGNSSNYGIGISQEIIRVPEVDVRYDDTVNMYRYTYY